MNLHLYIHVYLELHECTYYLPLIHIVPKLLFFYCTLAESHHLICLVQHAYLLVGYTGLVTEGHEQHWHI